MDEFIYDIKITDYLNNEELKKELNQLGKENWDVFNIIITFKHDINGKGNWKNKYALYMKKHIKTT